MKFDPQAMQALLALDDTALWQKIRSIATTAGLSLSPTTPPPAEMARLRSLMGGAGQADVGEALRTLSRFKGTR